MTKKVISAALLWLLLAGVALLAFWPSIPQSWLGWLLLVVVGPPLYLLSEVVGGLASESKLGRKLSGHPSRLLRITVLVTLGFVYVFAIFLIGNWLHANGT